MNAGCFEPATYALDCRIPVPWPANAVLRSDSRQDCATAGDECDEGLAYARRRYADTLWLPDSVMPLAHLVRTLRQPKLFIRDVLSQLLGSARAIAERFHITLPQVLEANVPEVDELAMWTAWKHVPEDTDVRSYLEKIEQREVQIQVLIHLLNLSLPPPPLTPSRKRKRGRQSKQLADGLPSVEERLEFFMDKLSMWQLTASLVATSSQTSSQPSSSQPEETYRAGDSSENKDWTQRFCEDVVEPMFKDILPEQCALLRSKLFRALRAERSLSRSPSPTVFSHGGSRGPTPGPDAGHPRATSPLRIEDLQRHTSRGPSLEPQRKLSVDTSSSQRDRSRSRSVSIVADEISAKGASRGGIVSSRALFKNREMPIRTSGATLQRTSSSSSLSALHRTKSIPHVPPTQPSMPSRVVAGEVLVPDTPAKRIKVEPMMSPEWRVPESPAGGTSQSLLEKPTVVNTNLTRFGEFQDDDDDSDGGTLKGDILAFDTPTKPKRR